MRRCDAGDAQGTPLPAPVLSRRRGLTSSPQALRSVKDSVQASQHHIRSAGVLCRSASSARSFPEDALRSLASTVHFKIEPDDGWTAEMPSEAMPRRAGHDEFIAETIVDVLYGVKLGGG